MAVKQRATEQLHYGIDHSATVFAGGLAGRSLSRATLGITYRARPPIDNGTVSICAILRIRGSECGNLPPRLLEETLAASCDASAGDSGNLFRLWTTARIDHGFQGFCRDGHWLGFYDHTAPNGAGEFALWY